jgi:hypothetical protein
MVDALLRQHSRVVAQRFQLTGGCMRKMIFMAIAGFIWKKVQARMANQAPAQGARRRY